MTTPQRRRCTRAGCPEWMTPPGTVCASHRAESPPRPYHRHAADPHGSRWCPRCETWRPIAEFSLPSGRVQGYCRACRLAATQRWRARYHDELLARRRATYAKADSVRSYGALHRHH